MSAPSKDAAFDKRCIEAFELLGLEDGSRVSVVSNRVRCKYHLVKLVAHKSSSVIASVLLDEETKDIVHLDMTPGFSFTFGYPRPFSEMCSNPAKLLACTRISDDGNWKLVPSLNYELQMQEFRQFHCTLFSGDN